MNNVATENGYNPREALTKEIVSQASHLTEQILSGRTKKVLYETENYKITAYQVVGPNRRIDITLTDKGEQIINGTVEINKSLERLRMKSDEVEERYGKESGRF